MSTTALRHHAAPVGVNATVTLNGVGIGGFASITAGTITITRIDGFVVLNAFPVAAGQWYFLPFITGHGAQFTTAGGASGTVATG